MGLVVDAECFQSTITLFRNVLFLSTWISVLSPIDMSRLVYFKQLSLNFTVVHIFP